MSGESAPPRVAITGAGGALGPVIAREFAAGGWRVTALLRSGEHAAVLPRGSRIVIGDLFDDGALENAFEGATAVIHLAALLHVIDAPAALAQAYRRINVDGTSRVAAAARSTGVRRLLHASTIAVYGYSRQAMLDERDSPSPDSDYARSKLESEQIVHAATNGQLASTVLRLAAVYGGRVKGNYETLVSALKRRRFVPVGAGGNRRTLVHEDDVARAFLLCATHAREDAGTFNVTDGETHTVAQIVEAICVALGRDVPRWHLPVPVAYAAASGLEAAFSLVGRGSPVTRGRLDKYLEDVQVSGQAFIQTFGFQPRDLDSGWRAAVDAMRCAGRI